VVIYYGGRIHAMGTLRELLVKPDTIRITMPPLPRQSMQAVLDIIRHDVAADKIHIDNPTQNLESYFLEVVRKAREDFSENSGATSGSRVAAYLRGDAESLPTSDKLLERLTIPAAPNPAQPAPSAEPASKIDQAKLASLAKAAEPEPPPAAPASAADLKKADEKLSSLLGHPPGK
jgi:ABC-2 type transport system ATP-binding protein